MMVKFCSAKQGRFDCVVANAEVQIPAKSNGLPNDPARRIRSQTIIVHYQMTPYDECALELVRHKAGWLIK